MNNPKADEPDCADELAALRAEVARLRMHLSLVAWERDPSGQLPDVPVLQGRYDSLRAQLKAATEKNETLRDNLATTGTLLQNALDAGQAATERAEKAERERDAFRATLETKCNPGSHVSNQEFPKDFEQWSFEKQGKWFTDTARAVYMAKCDDQERIREVFIQLWNILKQGNEALITQRDQAEADAGALREALKWAEWGSWNDIARDFSCPHCGSLKEEGKNPGVHHEACKIFKALSQPHPGAANLERLKAADGLREALNRIRARAGVFHREGISSTPTKNAVCACSWIYEECEGILAAHDDACKDGSGEEEG